MLDAVGNFLGQATRVGSGQVPGPLPAVVTEERVLDWIGAMQGRGLMGHTLRFRVTGLLRGCLVMYPSRNWQWLREIVQDLPDGRPESRRRKLKQLRDSRELFRLGLDIIATAGTRKFLRPHLRHVWARDGLMIAFLAFRPERIKNFSSLELGKQLLQLGDGRWRLRLEPEETKNEEQIDEVFPAGFGQMLDRYLAWDRPALLARRSGDFSCERHVWITEDGLPCTSQGIRLRVKEHTQRAFGIAISPHRFRDAGITTIAIEMPERMDAGLALLGNRSRATMNAHYNMSTSHQAGLKLIEVLERRMKELGL